MEDVRPLPAEQHDELEQSAEILPRAQRSTEVLELDEACSGSPRGLQQRAGTVCSDDDLVFLDEGWEQRGHIRLSSAGLGERDDDQDPGALSHSSPRASKRTTPYASAFSRHPAPLLAGFVAVVVFLVWAGQDGGYAPTSWYPGAFVFLVLAALVATSHGSSLPRPLFRAVTLFGGFTVWSFLSITWADAKGEAWDGANRTLLLFTVYTLFALLPWRPRDAALLLGALATGTAAIGSWVFLAGAESGLSEGRFTDPVGYANANAALFLAAFWPAAVLASRRETPWPARGLLFAVSGLLLQLGVLAQSRGSLPAFALALVLYLALVPDRARSLLTLLTIGVATALSAGRLLEVYRADPGKDLQQALASAKTALVLTAVCLAAAGVAIGLLERRRESAPSAAPRFRRLVVASVLVLGLAAAVTIVSGGPTSRLGDGLASGRYDLWRVAALEFADHPVQGVGADNFAVGYARERNSHEEPLYPHSIELRLLSQTGLVGTGLFVGFLAFAVAAALRSRRIDPTRAALASAGLVAFSYWFVHGSIDWFWEVPALAAPAFAVLGLAGGMSRAEPMPAGGPRRPRRAIMAIAVAGLVVASISLALPWLAARDVEAAVGTLGEGSRRSIRPTRARSSAQRAQRRARHRRRGSRATRRRSRAGERGPPPGGRPRAGGLVCPRRARDRRPRGGSTNCCSGAPPVRAAPESARADDTRAAGRRPSQRAGSGLARRATGPAGSGFAARPPSGRLPAGPRSLRRLLRPRGAAMNGAALARRRLAPRTLSLVWRALWPRSGSRSSSPSRWPGSPYRSVWWSSPERRSWGRLRSLSCGTTPPSGSASPCSESSSSTPRPRISSSSS